jgi:hypothetical protein
MAITTTQSAQLYLAYFGRPADPAGQNFWTQAGSSNTMQQQSNNFATAPEWTSAIAGLTNDQIVNLIYLNSFGHVPDAAGLRFWSDAITNGVLSVGDAAWQIVTNTGPADTAIVAAKVTAALGYTAAVAASSVDSVAYGNSAAFASANTWLDGITTEAQATAALVPAALDASLDAMVTASAGSVSTTYALTTGIDTINAAVLGANVLNTVTSGLQENSSSQTWNTGDSIIGNNLTTVSLIGNDAGVGTGSVVSVTNVAAINVNLVSDTPLNAAQWTNVAAVNITNGVAGSELDIGNATLDTTYGFSSARDYIVDLHYAGATGTADTAKLSISGTGTSSTIYSTIGLSNNIEAATIATSGTNYLDFYGNPDLATITVTGAGTNEITISMAALALSFDASAATGRNKIDASTLFSGDVFKGGSSTADELIADLSSVTQTLPTITGFEKLALTFSAAAIFNASKWTGGTELDLTPTGAVAATVTNLNQTVTTLNIGEDAAITATGAIAIGYATGASSAVTLNVGATSTSSNPAVSSTGALTLTRNAGALTINSVGDAANTLGAITANAVSALTIAGVAQNLTTGAVSANAAATVTVDGTLKNTTVTTVAPGTGTPTNHLNTNTLTVDESMTTFNLTSGAGTASLTLTGDLTNDDGGYAILQTAASGAIDSTFNITTGAKNATLGTIDLEGKDTKTVAATLIINGGAGATNVGAVSRGIIVHGGQNSTRTDSTGDISLNATIVGAAGAITVGDLWAHAFGKQSVDETLTVTSGAGLVTLGNGFNAANIKSDANSANLTVTATTGAGSIVFDGDVSVYHLNGLTYTNSSAFVLNATATDGDISFINGIVGIEGVNALDPTLSDSMTVDLSANGGNIEMTSGLEIGGANSALTLTAQSGNSITIDNLFASANNNRDLEASIETITLSGAGDISIGATQTDLYDNIADTVVDASAATGNVYLNLAQSSGNINVTLGNATTGLTNDVTTGSGADVVVGGTGSDTITGGLGADTITLETGTDTVIFTSYATTDSVTSFTTGAAGDVTGYSLVLLNTELNTVAGSRVTNGAGNFVSDGDGIDFSAVIGAGGITFAAGDNIFLTSATTSTDVAAYLAGSSFSTADAQTGDGIVIAWVDVDADLHISMATITESGVTAGLIASAVIDDMVVLTGTYTVAGLAAGNFDFLA